MRRAILAILIATGTSALAGDGGPDRRIRYVTYDPDAVVPVDAVVGIVTHIVLEPGESYVTHAFGDGKAWDFAAKANHCFLKAVATNADSNLTIVTDRRSYHFSLRLLADPDAAPTFEIAFRYPESDARKRRGCTSRSASAARCSIARAWRIRRRSWPSIRMRMHPSSSWRASVLSVMSGRSCLP